MNAGKYNYNGFEFTIGRNKNLVWTSDWEIEYHKMVTLGLFEEIHGKANFGHVQVYATDQLINNSILIQSF